MDSPGAQPPPVPAGPSDEALFQAFRRGDARALDALLSRHWEGAVRAARRVLADPALAEDAAQEAFVALAREGPDLRGPFARFFVTLVLNAARNLARGEGRRERRHQALERRRALETGAGRETVSEGERRLLASEVEDRVRLLPEDLRFALAWHYYEGRSHEEVGRLLGCPTGTASSRIRRGLERLRESLGASGYAAAVGDVEAALRAAGDPPAPGTSAPGPIDASPAIDASPTIDASLTIGVPGSGPVPVASSAPPSAQAILARAASLSRRAGLAKLAATALVALLCAAGLGRLLLPAPGSPAIARAPRSIAGDAGDASPGTGRAPAAVPPGTSAPAREGSGSGPGAGSGDAAPPAGTPADLPPPPALAGATAAAASAPSATAATAASESAAPSAPTAGALARLRVRIDLSSVPEKTAGLFVAKDEKLVPIDVIGGETPGKDFDLPAELYHVHAWPGSSLQGMYNPAAIEEVRLAPGEDRTLVVRIPPPEERTAIELCARLSDGAPAAGVELRLRRDLDAIEPGRRGRASRATTDASGTASFGRRPAGEYVVSTEELGPLARITHGGGRTRAEVVLRPLVPTVLRIVDEAGLPVPGVTVSFPGLERRDHCRSLEDGAVVPVLVADRSVESPRPGPLALPLGTIALGLQGASGARHDASVENAGAGEVRVVFPSSGVLRIEGRLARPADAPDGSRVEAHLIVPGAGPRETECVLRDGAFALALEGVSLTAGHAELFLRVGGAAPLRRVLPPGESTVRLGAIDLERGHALTGRAFMNGRPILSGEVVFRPAGSALAIRSSIAPADGDLAGRFRFEGLPPGPARIEVRGTIRTDRAIVDARGFLGVAPSEGGDARGGFEIDPARVEGGDLGDMVLQPVLLPE